MASVTSELENTTNVPAPPAPAGHANNFDFLRLCFAALVILAHSPELVDGNRSRELLWRVFHTFSFGDVGVAGFFILSGYLITQSWERSPGLLKFLTKRVSRIYPGFMAAALLTAFVFGPLGADARTYFDRFDYPAFVASLLALAVPVTPPTEVGNGSLWTIQGEFLCYLLTAALGLLGGRWSRFGGPLALAALAAFLLRKGILLPPFHLFAYYLGGMMCYHFRAHLRYTRVGCFIALAALVPAMFHPFSAWIGLTTAGAYLLFAFALRPIAALQGVARKADVSYGTYLYAWPIQRLLIVHWPGISPWLVFALALPLSLFAGWLSWHLVEKHFLRQRVAIGV